MAGDHASETFRHVPVLLEEVLRFMQPGRGGIYVDATVGGGGHAERMLDAMPPDGRLIGIDQDPYALQAAGERLRRFGSRVTLVRANFGELDRVLADLGVSKVDGVLFDLGVSSPQLDWAERGFRYQDDAPLDMRMDPESGPSAAELVNQASEEELRRWIAAYGEERWAHRIAREIVERRKRSPIQTTGALVEAIKAAIPAAARRRGPHPARRTFQALRIVVNRELEVLERALVMAFEGLAIGGRIVVISFHSLEDRIVKQFFRARAEGCICPPDLPVCGCGRRPQLRVLTRRPVTAGKAELERNPRARSAKLRAGVRVLPDKESE